MTPASQPILGTRPGSTPPISAIWTPKVKLKTKLPQGHQAEAGASGTFTIEEGLVVDQFGGLSGGLSYGRLWRAALRSVLPSAFAVLRRDVEATVPKDLLDDVGLTAQRAPNARAIAVADP